MNLQELETEERILRDMLKASKWGHDNLIASQKSVEYLAVIRGHIFERLNQIIFKIWEMRTRK